jgi:hypothetical protein
MLLVVFTALLRPGCGGQFVVLLLRLPFPVGLDEESIDQEDRAGDQERHDQGNPCAQRRLVRERDKHCGAGREQHEEERDRKRNAGMLNKNLIGFGAFGQDFLIGSGDPPEKPLTSPRRCHLPLPV